MQEETKKATASFDEKMAAAKGNSKNFDTIASARSRSTIGARLTQETEVGFRYLFRLLSFVEIDSSPSADSGRAVVSYWRNAH